MGESWQMGIGGVSESSSLSMGRIQEYSDEVDQIFADFNQDGDDSLSQDELAAFVSNYLN